MLPASSSLWMYTTVAVCMYCMYACIYVCIYVCMYVCVCMSPMYVRLYVCVCAGTLNAGI